jgi:hypothetical protein
MAIQNGPTRFIATPTGQASRRPGQASPEPAAPHICGRLWARPAYNSRSFFRPRLALSAPGCWPPKREPSQITPLFYPCSPGTGSFPRSWSGLPIRKVPGGIYLKIIPTELDMGEGKPVSDSRKTMMAVPVSITLDGGIS